jgi:hypothetical protein
VVLLIGALVVLAGMVPAQAQDEAAERIRSAYAGYENWATYQVQIDESLRYALVLNGTSDYQWSTQERDVSMSGWYDVTVRDNASVSLAVSGDSSSSVETSTGRTPDSWTVDLQVALLGGELFWRGDYQASPDDSFSLPGDWTPFTSQEAGDIPAFSEMGINRYLLQEGADPFIDEFDEWLDAADSIEGPQSFRLDRSTQGDVYIVTVNLADAPRVVLDRVRQLIGETESSVDMDALLENLTDNSTLLWGVILEPETGRLLGQLIELDLSARLESDSLQEPYTSLTLEFSEDQSVLFTHINEPVDTTELPG